MLKRISGTFTKDGSGDPAFLVPPSRAGAASSSPRSSPTLNSIPLPTSPSSPSYPFPYVPPTAPPPGPSRTLDRTVLHKSLASLSALLVALDELRETSSARAKAEKRVAKAVKDLAGGFSEKAAGAGGKSEVVVEALAGVAGMYEALSEVDAKHAKGVEKEYEGVNEACSKYLKKTAKEEKTYDDTLASLDSKISKATSSYQTASVSSSSSRNPHAALNSLTQQHTQYMTLLSNLSAQVQQTKATYGESIAERRETVVREVARVACGMAEKEWRNRVEGTKKGGKEVGRVVSGGAWCEVGLEEGGKAAFSGDADGEPSQRLSASPLPTPQPTTDTSPPMRQVQFESPQRNTTLRGPRAPSGSTSTALSAPPSSHPGQAPSSGSYDSSLSSATPSFRQQQPPPAVSPSPAQSAGVTFADQAPPPPSSRPLSQQPPPSPRPPVRSDSYEPRSPPLSPTALGELRRPTPRYGSMPPPSRNPVEQSEADEFGRSTGGGATGVKREDSFVARMSQKYSTARGGTGEEERRGRETSGAPPPQPLGHARSSSRVQLLAKRYSSPPDAVYPTPDSSALLSPTLSTSPPSGGFTRPQPPSTSSSSSRQYPSSASAGSFEPAPNRPQFGSSSSYQQQTQQSQQQPPIPPARRHRAYEDAQRLPSEVQPPSPHEHAAQASYGSFTSGGSSGAGSAEVGSVRSGLSGREQEQYAEPMRSRPPSQQQQPLSPSPAHPPQHHFSVSPSRSGGGGASKRHTRICACPDCTSAKYGASSGAGGEGLSKEEEERLQRMLRREKEGLGGTVRGWVAKMG
ncbi:hypothetical protein JCM8097_002908 [Rhodosporidiobolus ruineniae]